VKQGDWTRPWGKVLVSQEAQIILEVHQGVGPLAVDRPLSP
jgi:hypothetical protein